MTPVYQGKAYLEETIDSVLSQNYPNLDYRIIDGGSTDGTVEIIKRYEKHLGDWVSEPDKGMYDAIHKGLSKAKGEIQCYLNADDLFYGEALKIVGETFVRLPLMAFAKYTTFVWMGFGLGLLTFYATEFLQFAKWKSAGWIDSNISLISNISNYGLIFLIFLVYFMTNNFLKARGRENVSPEVNLTTKYLYYSFLVGLFVSGRHTALIFLGIGYMMSTNLDLEEQIPQEEDRREPD